MGRVREQKQTPMKRIIALQPSSESRWRRARADSRRSGRGTNVVAEVLAHSVHRPHRHHSSSAAASGGRAMLKTADLLIASTEEALIFLVRPFFFRMTQPGFDVSGHRPGDGSAQGAALDVPPGYSPVRSQSLCTKGVHRLHRHHSSSAAASGGRAILKGAADLLLASTGGVLFFSADQRTLQESGPAARRSAVEAAGAGAVESRGDGSRGPADPPRRAL